MNVIVILIFMDIFVYLLYAIYNVIYIFKLYYFNSAIATMLMFSWFPLSVVKS